MRIFFLFLAIFSLHPYLLFGKSSGHEDSDSASGEKEEPLKIGNLSLPTSQQPSPLIGIGENIIDAKSAVVTLGANEYRTESGYFLNLVPTFLYGIRDDLSLFITLPIAARYKDTNCHSSGLEDIPVQLEYAYYTEERRCYVDQATILANVTLPAGSASKTPATGFGSPSFTIAATYNHTAIHWFYFGALGATLTTFHSHSKNADQYLYQIGFGRNFSSPSGWIFAWMVEVDGVYSSKSLDSGEVDLNSGGNVLFITPSLWFSNKNTFIQFGGGGVITQNLFGDQPEFTYQFAVNCARTF